MYFAAYLIDKKLKSNTVKLYLSALRTVLAEEDIKLNEDLFLINSLTKACKIRNDQLTVRFPIQKDLLHLIIKEVRKYFTTRNQPYLEQLISAMMVAGYYGLLRAGELAQGPHTLLARNVHIGVNKKKLLFVLTTSKTHGKGDAPQLIKIASNSDKKNIRKKLPDRGKICPFKTLQDYIKIRPAAKSTEEQFFVFADNAPVKQNQLRDYLHIMLNNLQLPNNVYFLHSLRSGRACDLYKMGLSVETIKKVGRWRSNAVFTYLKSC